MQRHIRTSTAPSQPNAFPQGLVSPESIVREKGLATQPHIAKSITGHGVANNNRAKDQLVSAILNLLKDISRGEGRVNLNPTITRIAAEFKRDPSLPSKESGYIYTQALQIIEHGDLLRSVRRCISALKSLGLFDEFRKYVKEAIYMDGASRVKAASRALDQLAAKTAKCDLGLIPYKDICTIYGLTDAQLQRARDHYEGLIEYSSSISHLLAPKYNVPTRKQFVRRIKKN